MTETANLLAFMTDAADGKYEVTKPTKEQLAAVLPWMIDATIRYARESDLCEETYEALARILEPFVPIDEDREYGEDGFKYYDSDGYDCRGFDRNGYNDLGFDRSGYDKDGFAPNGRNRKGYDREGFDRNGYNKDGFDRYGTNRNGETREQAVAKLVKGWSKEQLELFAAKLRERQAAKTAEKVAEPATA